MSAHGLFSTKPEPVVYVVAMADGVDVALRKGVDLKPKKGPDATLVLLVPEMSDPKELVEVRSRRRLARLLKCEFEAGRIDPTAEVRMTVGSSLEDAIERAVPRRGTVVISGPARFWWPSRAQQLVEQLRRLGYDSVFVSTSQPGWLARFMWRRVLAAHRGELFGHTLATETVSDGDPASR
jgi:hypothetical protein